MARHIFIGSDHAGFDLKNQMRDFLNQNLKLPLTDMGTFSADSVDYPDIANAVVTKLREQPDSIGILICGSGQGMAMRANRFSHIRAALCFSVEQARLAREHNDANVLCLGARLISADDAFAIAQIFLQTAFSGGRHTNRVQKLSQPPTC